jgi:CDP-diacylglycerol--glycerol-3-phosphate 3-phosphatidyltransferase
MGLTWANWANRITIARILLIAPFIILMLKVHEPEYGDTARYAALAIFLFMAASDYLDGYLARKKKQATRLGAFLDPMADKLLMTTALLLLSSDPAHIEGFKLPLTVVVLIIGKDVFLLLGFLIVYFITFQVRVVPGLIGKWATVLQLSMVAGVLIGPEMSHVIPGWIWFLRALWWSAAGTAVLATLIYIRVGISYIEEFDQQAAHKAH